MIKSVDFYITLYYNSKLLQEHIIMKIWNIDKYVCQVICKNYEGINNIACDDIQDPFIPATN